MSKTSPHKYVTRAISTTNHSEIVLLCRFSFSTFFASVPLALRCRYVTPALSLCMFIKDIHTLQIPAGKFFEVLICPAVGELGSSIFLFTLFNLHFLNVDELFYTHTLH